MEGWSELASGDKVDIDVVIDYLSCSLIQVVDYSRWPSCQ